VKKTKIYLRFSLACLLIVLASWTRWYFTGSLKADENYIENNTWALNLYIFSYFSGFLLLVHTYYKIIFRKDGFDMSLNETRTLSLIGNVIFFFMTVIFASDIYTYLAEGELATRGIFTYTNGELVKDSKFIEYVSNWWKDCPNHYGPPLLFMFYTSVFIGKSVMASYWTFKILLLISALLLTQVIFLILKDQNTQTKHNLYALIVLAPLFLIEGIGQTHVDLVITLFIALFIYFYLKNRFFISLFFMAMAISCKIMYGVILIPLLIALLYVKFINVEKNIFKFLSNSAIAISIIGIIVAITYIPVWQGWETILTPMEYHKNKTPCRSFTELSILVYKFGGELISNGFNIPKLLIDAHTKDFLSVQKILDYQKMIAPILKTIGFLLALWSAIPLLRIKDSKEVFHVFARLWIIIITIYSPIFNPWYFMPILLLLLFTDIKSWMFYAIIVISQSINGQLGNSTIPIGNLWEVLASIQVLTLVPLFLLYFKKHLIIEPYQSFKNLKK
jgi:hypothetical protein